MIAQEERQGAPEAHTPQAAPQVAAAPWLGLPLHFFGTHFPPSASAAGTQLPLAVQLYLVSAVC
jgi:hypothetical protein